MQQKTAEIPPNRATPRSWLATSCSINVHNCTINICNCLINIKQSSLTVRGCSGSHCPGSVLPLPRKLGRDHNLGKQTWNIWILRENDEMRKWNIMQRMKVCTRKGVLAVPVKPWWASLLLMHFFWRMMGKMEGIKENVGGNIPWRWKQDWWLS